MLSKRTDMHIAYAMHSNVAMTLNASPVINAVQQLPLWRA